MNYATISFYRYFPVENPTQFKQNLQKICQEHRLTGRILIAKEGINGAVSGKKENIEQFKEILCEDFFSDLTFREQEADTQAHPKLTVKVRKEIVHFGKEVDLKKRGTFLKAEELQRWYADKEQKKEKSDFVIVDARNDYEWKVGRFKNAVTLPLKNFREFPEQAKTIEKYKDKKIVLYCTGGIRCEKASAYLKEQGFPEVYHIEGGIINYFNYLKQQGKRERYLEDDAQSFWEGGLFVFDNRLVSETGNPITKCAHCGKAAEKYQNCFNLECDTLFVGCNGCLKEMKNTCSEKCKEAPRQRKTRKEAIQREILGKVENYYAQKKIVLVKVEKNIVKEQTISFSGKTTREFTQQISELRNKDGEEIYVASEGAWVTFPVEGKVRKGDRVEIVVPS